jgi:hypothetical protein
MTKLKGFKKNRYELDKPVAYLTFETGYTAEILATSARDAEIKTMNLQSDFGFYKSAKRKLCTK